MKVILSALGVLCAVSSANAFEIVNCDQQGVDLRSVVQPVAKNARNFYKNQVVIYNIDQIEPAAAAMGLAIVMPDPESEVGDSKCLAITGFGEINVMDATVNYNPATGLNLWVPYSNYDENGSAKRQTPIQIRIKLDQSTVTIVKAKK